MVAPVGLELLTILPAFPLVTLKWVVLLVLINALDQSVGLEVVHAEVADLRSPIRVGELAAVVSTVAREGAAALELLADIAALVDTLVGLSSHS